MKKYILIASVSMMILGIINDSRADCPVGIVSCSDNCNKATSFGSGRTYTASGSNCKWSITDEGILIIERIDKTQPASTGSYAYGTPWSYSGVKAIVLDGVTASSSYGLGMGTISVQKILTMNRGSATNLSSFGFSYAQFESCSDTNINSCLVSKGLSRKCGSGKYYQEGDCVSGCGTSFRLNDGECDRIRYTPAEAAAIANDDSTNVVTLTFKK